MEVKGIHLTYCSNIHPGVSWADHFNELQRNIPSIKQALSPDAPLALGLRLAHEASIALTDPEQLAIFKQWLKDQNVYVFTMNGFPYGDFHGTFVKDHVHTPDWTTVERKDYTLRLFQILAKLLPEGMHGGVSTPPLSYRHWWKTQADLEAAKRTATQNILEVVVALIATKNETGVSFHLDIEPEPDGILDNGADFFAWYEEVLLPMGIAYLGETLAYTEVQAKAALYEHVQLCYDVCHFAVSYEEPKDIVDKLQETGIQVGKIQVSSALRVDLTTDKAEKLSAIKAFDEPIYLHQVVAKTMEGNLIHFRDLGEAFNADTSNHTEWRVHFHVPLFIDSYGLLHSTQPEIEKTLALHKQALISPYLEIETYTWGVLPENMQKPMDESIVRELEWVKSILEA